MRALLAIFMVVLIGNPVCCCAFVSHHVERESVNADLPPCCQARLAAQAAEEGRRGGDESPSPACPCAAKLGFVTADKVFAPVPPSAACPAPSSEWTDFAGPVPGIREAFSPDPVPGIQPASLSPPPRILYGVFRC